MSESCPAELLETAPLAYAATSPFGAALLEGGGVRFRLWAPEATEVRLVEWRGEDRPEHIPEKQEGGWYECSLDHGVAGMFYQWKINGDTLVPDPASRYNPDGPHGPSQVIDPRNFPWQDSWSGRPWSDVVLYELHVGTYTPEGTYAAAETRLDALVATGITAVELMPLSTFPGEFGWGYDGVLPFAPNPSYGTPDQLKHFIQAAHARGLMVFLDVVYNHFGPDGNYLNVYAPQFFSKVHMSPWGNALNFDRAGSDTVRDFFVQNAIFWLQEYRFDGLRLDAVHAIKDDSALDVVDELAKRVHAHFPVRHIHLVLENQNNDHYRLPGDGLYDAQWNDDFHHTAYVVATGDAKGYYRDYAERPVELLGRCLTHGFLWEGAARDENGARKELNAAPAQPLGAMVNFLNNHDQSGNRAFGERFSKLVPPETLPLMTALTLLSPSTPLLFAGEEFGATTPFLYFADWDGELGQQVTEGRAKEFAHFMEGTEGDAQVPPACEVNTFEACRLDWQAAQDPQAVAWRAFVSAALAVRRECFTSRVAGLIPGAHVTHMLGERCFVLRWRYDGGAVIQLEANLSGEAVTPLGLASRPWPALHDEHEIFNVKRHADAGQAWPAWSGRWTLGHEESTVTRLPSRS